MHHYSCHNCNAPMKFSEDMVGRFAKCPKCGKRQKVKKPSNFEWIDLHGEVVNETEKAILFYDKASGHQLWFPRSMADEVSGGIHVPKQWYEERLADIAKGQDGDQYKRWFAWRRGLTMMTFQWVASNAGFPGEPIFAGFMIKVGKACNGARQYHKAFLPLQVAVNNPDLLPPYYGICMPDTCECEFEEVESDKRTSMDTPMIVAEGEVVTIAQWKSRQANQAAKSVTEHQIPDEIIQDIHGDAARFEPPSPPIVVQKKQGLWDKVWRVLGFRNTALPPS